MLVFEDSHDQCISLRLFNNRGFLFLTAKKMRKICIYAIFVVNLQPILRAYENIVSHRTCSGGDVAALRGGDLPQGPYIPLAAYSSERAHEKRQDPLRACRGQDCS